MKKVITAFLGLALAMLVLAGCSSSSTKDKEVFHIGILQYVEHPSLTAAREGFVDELKKRAMLMGRILSSTMRMLKGISLTFKQFQQV